MYKRILIPTDGSACSEQGLRHGLKLAARVEAEVIFLHVLEPVAAPTHAGIPAFEAYESSRKAQREVAHRALENGRRSADEAGVRAQARLDGPADAAETIAAVADKESCDLIVMGSHGRSGLRRFVLGSVTEGVLRRTTVTLLVVHCTGQGPGGAPEG